MDNMRIALKKKKVNDCEKNLKIHFNLDAFISSCLIVVARTSSTMWNRGDESKHPYLLPNLKENTFAFAH